MLAIKILVHKILHGEILEEKLYILGNQGDDVTQYTLTNDGYGYEYDLRYVDESTATTFSVASQDNTQQDSTSSLMDSDVDDSKIKMIRSTSIHYQLLGTSQRHHFHKRCLVQLRHLQMISHLVMMVNMRTSMEMTTKFTSMNYQHHMILALLVMSFQSHIIRLNEIVSATILGFEFGNYEPDFMLQDLGGYEENGSYRVHQFNLSEPWNVRTADYVNSFRLYWGTFNQPTTPKGITFKPDGKQFTVVCDTSDYAVTYDLETPWELSSAHYMVIGEISILITMRQVVLTLLHMFSTFNSDGTEFYTIGSGWFITKWGLKSSI